MLGVVLQTNNPFFFFLMTNTWTTAKIQLVVSRSQTSAASSQ